MDKELRIGNLVYYTPLSVSWDEISGPQSHWHESEIFEVRSICADPVNKFDIRTTGVNPVLFNGNDEYARVECSISFKQLTPIPITEEKLIDFGFKKYPNRIIAIDVFEEEHNSNLSFGWENGKLHLKIECDDSFYNRIIISDIKYIHRLQNLYYDFTGKEFPHRLT